MCLADRRAISKVGGQQSTQRANHTANHYGTEVTWRPFTVLAARLCFLDEDNTFRHCHSLVDSAPSLDPGGNFMHNTKQLRYLRFQARVA
jgi:hypothetical protein